MQNWFWWVILGTAIWVLVDAKSIGVKKGVVPGLGNMGPWAWFFVTLLLWIVGFPMYLYYRGKFQRALKETNQPPAPIVSRKQETMSLDDLEKLGELKAKGIISQDEFDAKKKAVLGL